MDVLRIKNENIKRQESWLKKPKLFLKWLKVKLFSNSFLKDFLQNEIVDWLLLAGFLANLVDWILLAIFIRPVDVDIVLHYNIYFGVDVMGNWKRVFLLPIVGLILLFINNILAVYFYRRKKVIASYILLLTTLIIQINLIVASISLVIINR